MSPSLNTCRETAASVGSFEAQVAATIDAYHLLHAKDRVLVAVSGGPDSVALLHALIALRDRYDLSLIVAYLNHGLREAAAAEQAFVAGLARRLALPFHTDRRDVRTFRQRQGLSLEDAARQVRYAYLEDTAEAQACTKIATGHQADDTAELLLMNLLRGSGLLGMSGIAPRQGRVIRPLIDIHRDAVMAYLEGKNQDTCHDESNDDPSFTRNRIRNDLIPHLEAAYNPRLRQALQRTARILRDEEAWIETHLDAAWPGSGPSPCREAPYAEASAGAEGMRLDRPALMAAPVALQRRILRRALAGVSADLKGLALTHIEEIRRLADDGRRGSRWLDLPRGLRVLVEADHVTLLKESAEARRRRRRDHGAQAKADEVYRIEIACPGENAVTVTLTQIDARLELRSALYNGQPTPDTPWTAYFDLELLTFPLMVRPVQLGDRLRPLGMAGHKKISDLFIDCKIPKPKRHRFPVLVSGGRIIWVAGVRRDHDTRVRTGTRRLLIGEFCLLK